jgi:SAM-dependent methyltransferase
MNREIELLCKIHEGLPRQGPGSNDCTEKAFRMIPGASPHLLILDVGCGSGMQTIELARLSHGHIIGFDIHEPFLRDLTRRSEDLELSSRIAVICGSMFDLTFKGSVFDVVWSEGVMYIMGFENGLNSFRKLLRPRGYMALTELTWLKDNPPEELVVFWNSVYPGMQGLRENIDMINIHGFAKIGHFVLPPEAWWDNYYVPLESRLSRIVERYIDDSEAVALFEKVRLEIDLYKKYSEYYGYVFYIMQKTIGDRQ